jgi:zinc and cadmium transporter
MDSTILWIIAFTLLGGVLSVLAASLFLLLRAPLRARLMPWLVSFAIGAMLGAAFLGLLPEAFEANHLDGPESIAYTVLIGLLIFFTLEKMVLWRHCHTHDCEVHGSELEHAHKRATGNMILIGDGIHNSVDGVLIAAAFMTDVHLGVATSLAVVAHEIPQEIGNFAVLLHSGFSRKQALTYNIISSLTTIIGGVVAYFSLAFANAIVPYVLALAASNFIYIAVADLIPGLHKRPEISATVQQIALILLGVGAIALVEHALH